MPKAISYIRFSSGTQAKGSTQERQNSLISSWLKEHPDVGLSNLSQADLGRSGYSGQHLEHGLGKLLKAINEGYIKAGDFILVEAIDRIGRLAPTEMMNLIQEIIASGVIIVTLEDNLEYSTKGLNTNSSAFFILIGKIQQAHDYSKNLSRRISAAHEGKRKKAKLGEPIKVLTPFWLTTKGKLIPEKAKFVNECINLYLKGYGTRRILIELSEGHTFAKEIHPSTIKKWLRSKALIGVWETKGEEIDGVFEPLIDTSTYYLIQSEFQRRRREMAPEQTYALSGLIVCEECSARYYFRRKIHKDSVIIYANCSTYLKRGTTHCTNNRTWPYEVLLAIFESTYAEILADKAWDYSLIKVGEELDAKKMELVENDQRKNKILDLLLSSKDSNDKVLKQRYEEAQDIAIKITEDIAVLQARLKNESDEINTFTSRDFDDSQSDIANSHIESIESDWIQLREYLKKHGYKIEIRGDFAWVSASMGRIRYSVKKRSQLYGCYIVEVVYPEHKVLMQDSDEHYLKPPFSEFWAVDRIGVRCAEESKERLIETLSNISGSHEYLSEFS